MAIATDAQVQTFVNEMIRPRCEQIRHLAALITNDLALLDDVYAALTQQNPTWRDVRDDAPPHLLVPNDVLAINTILHEILDAYNNSAQKPILLKACVRSAM